MYELIIDIHIFAFVILFIYCAYEINKKYPYKKLVKYIYEIPKTKIDLGEFSIKVDTYTYRLEKYRDYINIYHKRTRILRMRLYYGMIHPNEKMIINEDYSSSDVRRIILKEILPKLKKMKIN